MAVETGGGSSELLKAAGPDLQIRDLTESKAWCDQLNLGN